MFAYIKSFLFSSILYYIFHSKFTKMSPWYFNDDETNDENPNHGEYGSEPKYNPKEDYGEPDNDNNEVNNESELEEP